MKHNDTPETVLTRDGFREAVFVRDGYRCVMCGSPAQDAHHILERRLWPDGGYYLSNGASVCGPCHIKCEETTFSVEEVREACGITNPTIPPHLYGDVVYDKWGNIVLPTGRRLKGELFHDESVQKILNHGGFLDDFDEYVKYPRTHHLPWSKGITDDDRVIDSMEHFVGKNIVVTEKMDGENSSMYRDYYHARSIDSRNHPSRNWVKNFWSQICHEIPQGWRVCGENMFAQHSISYENLESYFLGFSIWTDLNICLSWKETLEYFELMGITPVKVLYSGIYDEAVVCKLNNRNWNDHEGYVLRLADEFHYKDFRRSAAKFVREGHVQTVKHWMHGKPVEPNKLKT